MMVRCEFICKEKLQRLNDRNNHAQYQRPFSAKKYTHTNVQNLKDIN